MARNFRDDDRDKAVFTAQGARVGTISEVNDGRATVRRDDDESLTDEITEMLGWSDDDETHDLGHDHVDRYEEDGIYLRGRR